MALSPTLRKSYELDHRARAAVRRLDREIALRARLAGEVEHRGLGAVGQRPRTRFRARLLRVEERRCGLGEIAREHGVARSEEVVNRGMLSLNGSHAFMADASNTSSTSDRKKPNHAKVQ